MNPTPNEKGVNKCEEAGLAHAWRGGSQMWGFEMQYMEFCANCELKRTKCSQMKEWWSYSDGRGSEDIINIRPV